MNKDMQSKVETILADRQKIHGTFADNARLSQNLKALVFAYSIDLNDEQHEALEMILHKVARIACGDPNHVDHWDDIAGYATLASRSIIG